MEQWCSTDEGHVNQQQRSHVLQLKQSLCYSGVFHSFIRCLRELWELLKEALHHLADLEGQFSSGRDHQGTDLHTVAEMTTSECAKTLFHHQSSAKVCHAVNSKFIPASSSASPPFSEAVRLWEWQKPVSFHCRSPANTMVINYCWSHNWLLRWLLQKEKLFFFIFFLLTAV